MKENNDEYVMCVCVWAFVFLFIYLFLLYFFFPGQSGAGGAQYLSDPNLQVIFCSADPPILVLYNASTGMHTIWNVRKATVEVSIKLHL